MLAHPCAVAITDRQRNILLERQWRQALCRTPVATLRMGAQIIDGGCQLPLCARVGRGGEQGRKDQQAQRNEARRADGVAHGTQSSEKGQR